MDIVKRLREDAEYHLMVSYDADCSPEATINHKHHRNNIEAADEIERLRKQNQTLALDHIASEGQWCDLIGAKEKEIERLRKELRYQEHRDGRIGTHDSVCYKYGPSHYECALREIERLREALREIACDCEAHCREDGVGCDYGIARAALKEGE